MFLHRSQVITPRPPPPPPTPVTKMFYKDPRKGPLKYYDDTNDAKFEGAMLKFYYISCDLDQGPLTPAM